MSIFSPDSKFMRMMSRAADLIILNIIYVITCIPIITIGAATTSLYTVTFRIGTKREDGIIKPYFKAFKENFKQSTIIWLILALIGFTAYFNGILFYAFASPVRYLFIVFVIIAILVLFIGSYVFPLLSQFDNKSNKQVIKNGLIFSLAYLPRTLVIAVLNILPFILLGVDVLTFFYSGFLWIAIYFSAASYLSSHLLRKVFAPYMPKENIQEDDAI